MKGSLLDGRYRIGKRLGQGAMGAVYEAEHTGTGRRVAVKVIRSEELAKDEVSLGRFEREARAAGAIDTQYITQVLDTGQDSATGTPYMVMEYLTGEDVQHMIKRLGPVPPDLALRIAAQACLGLQKAHEASVVHRDIKPANLFLARRDAGELVVKLLDFGIAKMKMEQAAGTEGAGLTQTGNMLGSPLYMSPEQARGDRAIDHRADVWSLGVVLYQLLCARTPYQHVGAFGALIIAIVQEHPRPLQDYAPWVPPEIAAVVHGALQKNPAERYQSTAAMFEAIRAFLPNGWTIREDMVARIDPELRALVAPRLNVPGSESAGETTSTGITNTDGPQSSQSGPVSSSWPGGGSSTKPSTMSVAAGRTSEASAEMSSMQPSQTSSLAQGPESKVPLILGAGLATLIGATAGLYLFVRKAPEPPARIEANAQPIQSTPAPGPSVAPGPSAVEPSPAPSMRRVKLVVAPRDVIVEINGKTVPVTNGVAEVEGALGSIHRVRLSKGASETLADVIVAEFGASPPMLELAAKTTAQKPSGAQAAPPPAPTSKPTLPGIKRDFE